MYGTIARFKLKPGMEDRFRAYADRYETLDVPGYVSNLVYRSDNDPNEYYMSVVFDSKEAYHANAADPAQHTRYTEWRDMMESDPEWHDGEVFWSHP